MEQLSSVVSVLQRSCNLESREGVPAAPTVVVHVNKVRRNEVKPDLNEVALKIPDAPSTPMAGSRPQHPQ